MSAASIALEVAEVKGQLVSAQTIHQTLQQVGLHGRHPRRKPLLKLAYKKACKQFAEDNMAKSMNYWNHVLWSDESNGAFPLHSTARYGSVHFWGVFHWVLYLAPGTFLVPPQPRFQASRTVTKTWRVNSTDHWLAGENRHYCVTELATRDPPLQPDPLDLNQHSQRRIGRNFCLNKRTFLHQPQNSSVDVCWGSTDVPLVDSRRADPVRAWWHDAEGKSLMYITLLLNLLYFQSMFSVYIFNFVSVFCFN